jgi:hypothetical protein
VRWWMTRSRPSSFWATVWAVRSLRMQLREGTSQNLVLSWWWMSSRVGRGYSVGDTWSGILGRGYLVGDAYTGALLFCIERRAA